MASKYAAYVLVACLSFIGGRLSNHIELPVISIPSVVSLPEIGTVAVVEEVTDRPRVVAQMVAAGWFAEQQGKGVVSGLWDDDLKGASELRPLIEKAGGVPVVVILDKANKHVATKKLTDSDTIETVEKWIAEVGRYAS
jgi:hypothetical protein